MTSIAEVAQALREADVVRVSVLKAFTEGDVVFVECTKPFSAERLTHARAVIEQILGQSGVRVVLLGEGMRIVAREETTTVPQQ